VLRCFLEALENSELKKAHEMTTFGSMQN
jgi:hypothetical protein